MPSVFLTVIGITIACSFTLVGELSRNRKLAKPSFPSQLTPGPPYQGNAITQSFMSIPALLVDFPRPSSPEHAAAARRLGRQWPVFWHVGNVFFRPLSMLGLVGYLVAALLSSPHHGRAAYVAGAAAHLVTIVHSAVHMQPLNARLHALAAADPKKVDDHDHDERNGRGGGGEAGDSAASAGDAAVAEAEAMARRWAELNILRLVMPLVAGTVALVETLRH